MLAEPKYRQKYSINPRGLDWTRDDSKIGQKMLEKMGWKKGSGLGLKENGEAEPIKVLTKSDRKGIGCTVKHADNWIAHQDDFTSILAGLNAESSCSQNSNEDSVVTSFSLEEKSKNSRSRVHYQKFAKGKDLSRYESADLQSIFGQRKKQASDNKECNTTSGTQPTAESTSDKSFGVVTVTNATSIGNYFAQKMAEIKRRLAGNNVATITTMQDVETDSGPCCTINPEEALKDSKKRSIEECTVDECTEVDKGVQLKKKKKRSDTSLNEVPDLVEGCRKGRTHQNMEDDSNRSISFVNLASSNDLGIMSEDQSASLLHENSDTSDQRVKVSKRESRKNKKIGAESIVDSVVPENTQTDNEYKTDDQVLKLSRKESRKKSKLAAEVPVNLTQLLVEIDDESAHPSKIQRKKSRKERNKSAEVPDDLTQQATAIEIDDDSAHASKIQRKERKTSAEVPVSLTQQPNTIEIDDDSAHASKIQRKESRKERKTSAKVPVSLTQQPTTIEIDDDSAHASKIQRKESRKERKTSAEVPVSLTQQPTTIEIDDDSAHDSKIKRKESRKERKTVDCIQQPIAIEIDGESAPTSKVSRKNRKTSVEAPVDVDLTQLPVTVQSDKLDNDNRALKVSKIRDSHKNRRTDEVPAVDVDLTNELDGNEQPSLMVSDLKSHSKRSKKNRK